MNDPFNKYICCLYFAMQRINVWSFGVLLVQTFCSFCSSFVRQVHQQIGTELFMVEISSAFCNIILWVLFLNNFPSSLSLEFGSSGTVLSNVQFDTTLLIREWFFKS